MWLVLFHSFLTRDEAQGKFVKTLDNWAREARECNLAAVACFKVEGVTELHELGGKGGEVYRDLFGNKHAVNGIHDSFPDGEPIKSRSLCCRR